MRAEVVLCLDRSTTKHGTGIPYLWIVMWPELYKASTMYCPPSRPLPDAAVSPRRCTAGKQRWLSLKAVPIRGPPGSLRRVLATVIRCRRSPTHHLVCLECISEETMVGTLILSRPTSHIESIKGISHLNTTASPVRRTQCPTMSLRS